MSLAGIKKAACEACCKNWDRFGTAIKIATAVLVGWSALFIAYQQYIQEEIFEAFTSASAGGDLVNVTRVNADHSNFFVWTDRVRVAIASTAFNDVYMQEGPFDVEIELKSVFTPFGLFGSATLTENTRTAENLYTLFERILNGIAVSYSMNGLFGGIEVKVSSAPFSIRMSTDEVGVGPIEWEISTNDDFQLGIDVRPDFSFAFNSTGDDLKVKKVDPAGNEKVVEFDDFSVEGVWVQKVEAEKNSFEELGRPWFIRDLKLSASAVKSLFSSPKGNLRFWFVNPELTLDQRTNKARFLNGHYKLFSDMARCEIESFVKPDFNPVVEFDDFALNLKSKKFPLALLNTSNPLDVEEILRDSNPFCLEVDSRFNINKEKGHLYLNLDLEKKDYKVKYQKELPAFFWDVSAKVPKDLVQTFEVIVNSKRRTPVDFEQFMSVQPSKSRVKLYSVDFKRKKDGSVILNNETID